MKNKSNITFFIFAFNEEKRIEYVIRNFIQYGDVIIMDGGSTDRTQEIAEGLGALFLRRPIYKTVESETEENLDFMRNAMKTDWIYWGFVDNIAPKTLVEKMVEISLQDKFKMVIIPLFTYLWGNTKNFVHKGGTPFLFHKDFLTFKDNYIHGMGKFLGTEEQKLILPRTEEYALHHFSTYTITKFVKGHLNYAEVEAKDKQRLGKKFSSLRMLAAMIRYCWIFRRSLAHFRLGLITMFCYAFSRFMVYARLYELENDITLESVEHNYSIAKEKMLEDFK